MTNFGVVVGGSPGAVDASLRRGQTTLDNRPNLAEPWTYVETGDPELDTPASPPWTSDIYFVTGSPIAFRCGLDGQLDMIGTYDLSAYDISGGPVADDAFTLPGRWRSAAPPVAHFPVEIATDVYIMAVQKIDISTGVVRICWPITASPIP